MNNVIECINPDTGKLINVSGTGEEVLAYYYANRGNFVCCPEIIKPALMRLNFIDALEKLHNSQVTVSSDLTISIVN
jgi:hypothetical protein